VSKAYVDTSIALAVNAARVPIFGPSGSGHAPGIVPDPGLTTGASRYLREDGTWDTPPGGGLGTMATQNASAVAITGGTVTIGAPGCVQTAFGVNGCNLPLANYTATTKWWRKLLRLARIEYFRCGYRQRHGRWLYLLGISCRRLFTSAVGAIG
jgi:hypothetical protein